MDTATGKPLREFAELPNWMNADIRSHDGKLRAEFRFDAPELFPAEGKAAEVDIHLVEAPSGALRRVLKGLQARIDNTLLSRDGRVVAPGALNAVFSPDGRTVASGGLDGTVHLWEIVTGKERLKLTGHQGNIFAVAFSPDGRTIASAGADGTVLLWDVSGLTPAERKAAATGADLNRLWDDLASADAGRSYHAAGVLAALPDETVALLQKRLRPASAADEKRLAGLIADLDHPQFATRQRATIELEKLAEVAAPALRRALAEQPPLEVRLRLERLLELLDAPLTHAERLQALRGVEFLERVGTKDARDHLQALAEGTPESRVTQAAQAALRRLAK